MIVSRTNLVTLGLVLIGSILANPGDRIPNHPNCTDHEGPIPVYFVHPTNCSRFYECKQKDAWEFECAAGLHFNSKLNVCDYPANAECEPQSGGTTTNPPMTTDDPSPTVSSSTVEYTTTSDHPTQERTTTSPYPTPEGTTTSSSYPTPEGTTTSSSYPTPDYTTTSSSYPTPDGTTTSSSYPTPPGGTTHTTTTSVHTTTTSFPTPESSTNDPTKPQPNCPPSGATQPNYWKDDSDCTRYLGCLENCIQEFQCPSGLNWNDQQKQCDSLPNVQCCPVIPPAPNVWPSSTTTTRSARLF
uniref:Chitin-binding type-2 domain-containing protein n=1 Tax=Anopheles culicifacies TaxID=139723 RepID=A0A182MKE7_9DIPT